MKKKSSKNKRRNPYALLASRRKAGRLRNKKDKRVNGENKQDSFLNEDYYED